MRRLESILNYLHNKGWDIKEADTKTLTAYVCKKINTTMEIAFVDKNDHTIKRKDETTVIDAIKIKSVKVDKNVSIPRKDDMLNELIYFSKQRIDIIYCITDENTKYMDDLKMRGFEIIMKGLNDVKYLKLYCQSKLLGAYKSTAAEIVELTKFANLYSDAGISEYDDVDRKYKIIIAQSIYSVKDIDYICMYLTIAKDYYETENNDYGGIYDIEVETLRRLIEKFTHFS